MSTIVKICGIGSVAAADAAVQAGADYAGLVFHAASPRSLPLDAARALAAHLRGRVRLVAIFADANDGTVATAVDAVKPDMLQLHGTETPARTQELRARFGLPVLRAISVADASDLASVPAFEAVADMLLFDAKAPKGATRSGGHGAAFDWQLLRGRTFHRPWLLGGGLTPENVARAIKTAEAPGVDVSSGVETAPGEKSATLIREFIANARNARFAAEAGA